MMKGWILALSFLTTAMVASAQMPTNDNKEFEYKGEVSVKRAGSGDLQKRLEHWAKEYFADAVSLNIAVDDTTKKFVEVDVTESMVESHFGVNRSHKSRTLSYHIKFDAERKDYTYTVNDFKYKAIEVDRKGEETTLDGKLSALKTAASKSLEEEIHMRMTTVIEAFIAAAEIELEE